MHPDVSATDLEGNLAALNPVRPVEGLFGPDSVTWRVTRNAALFAGAWRAAILQLAHPWVARAIEEHSDTVRNPVGRFHRTFRVIFTFLFGDWDRVKTAARNLHRLHGTITGHTREATPAFPSGTPYSANQREALTWVLYTLWDTALHVHEELVGALSSGDKDAYVREGARFAALFGLAERDLPADFAALQGEMARMMREGPIAVTPAARRLAEHLLRPRALPFSQVWSGPVRAVTGAWMPEPLRSGFGFDPAPGRVARFWVQAARTTLRLLPGAVTRVPPYLEACRRLRGENGSPAWLRLLSRSWLGCDRLVAGTISPAP